MNYRPSQSAAICDAALKAAVRDMDTARHRAVLWFADIQERRLYRDLGFSNMAAYATDELKFSKTRTNDFLRLARKLEGLPTVRNSMAAGKIGYTKAVEIIKVATPKTEATWVDKAMATGRRDLARQVKRVKAQAVQRGTGQPSLLPNSRTEAKLVTEVPVRVTLDMTPEQFARYEALLEKAGALGTDRVEVLLASLETLTSGTSNGPTECHDDVCDKPTRRRVAGPPFQIHIRKCPDCDESTVQTSRGEVGLGRADTDRITCDARILEIGRPNRATIPPSRRAQVIERDGFHCRAPGCTHTRFLEVHHRIPRAKGGGNELANLITLCAGCHRLHHERGRGSVMIA